MFLSTHAMMKKTLSISIITICIILSLFFGLSANALTVEDTGLKKTAETAEIVASGATPPDIADIVGFVVGALLSLIGVVFMIFIIYGGIMWMTAEGNSERVKKAGEILKNSAIGLIIVLAAYAVVSFVFNLLLESVA